MFSDMGYIAIYCGTKSVTNIESNSSALSFIWYCVLVETVVSSYGCMPPIMCMFFSASLMLTMIDLESRRLC